MTPDEFRRVGHDLVDWVADYQQQVAERRVTPTVAPGDVRAQLPEHPPAAVEDMYVPERFGRTAFGTVEVVPARP